MFNNICNNIFEFKMISDFYRFNIYILLCLSKYNYDIHEQKKNTETDYSSIVVSLREIRIIYLVWLILTNSTYIRAQTS